MDGAIKVRRLMEGNRESVVWLVQSFIGIGPMMESDVSIPRMETGDDGPTEPANSCDNAIASENVGQVLRRYLGLDSLY
jgi:hypothetical protein